MSVLMQFGQVLGRSVFVQLVTRMLMDMLGLLPGSMNVRMRMLMRVDMIVGVRMDGAVGMLVLVGVDMRVGVYVFVFDLGCHDILLLGRGMGAATRTGNDGSCTLDMELYGEREEGASQRLKYDGIGMRNTASVLNTLKDFEIHEDSLVS